MTADTDAHLAEWISLLQSRWKARARTIAGRPDRRKLHSILLNESHYQPRYLQRLEPTEQSEGDVIDLISRDASRSESAYLVTDGPHDGEMVEWPVTIHSMFGMGYSFGISVIPGRVVYLELEEESSRWLIRK